MAENTTAKVEGKVGGSGSDSLNGGKDADLLTGGRGADLFIFAFSATLNYYDSGNAAADRDVITDFATGIDHLKLTQLSSQSIDLIDGLAFSGANQVRWVSKGGSTTVFINGDVDLQAEMAITLQGVADLSASDFLLFP